MDEQNEVYTAGIVKVEIKIHQLDYSFTRQEAITRLMVLVGAAAQTFGPYSDEVDALEDDLAEVRGGVDLADFEWLFPEIEEAKQKMGLEG